ncbi:hypothetical protein RF11_07520 [Thelohanellus kitauei]|uniref:Uncharacterized protein n=1 Tax=Thelohanellus kitauei TaxID=669202 RepID=A0A0C2I8S1_THEKT|nr:hypothetical protein RF11_07520 [Thelohanellus kitauei]
MLGEQIYPIYQGFPIQFVHFKIWIDVEKNRTGDYPYAHKVVRRGNSVTIYCKYVGPIEPELHKFSISAQFKYRESFFNFMIYNNSAARNLHLECQSRDGMINIILTPSERAAVGSYVFDIYYGCTCIYSIDLTILFNPYFERDSTYLPSEEHLKKYLESKRLAFYDNFENISRSNHLFVLFLKKNLKHLSML